MQSLPENKPFTSYINKNLQKSTEILLKIKKNTNFQSVQFWCANLS